MSKKLKISMFVWNSMENDARVLNEARTLARAGHEVVVHALLNGDKTPASEAVEPGFTIQRTNRSPFVILGVRDTAPDGRKRRSILRWITVLISRFFAHLIIMKDILLRRPDAIHSHDVNTLPTAWISSGLSRARLVYDAHEISTDREGYRDIAKIIHWVEKVIMPRCDATITTTDMRAEHFEKAYGIAYPTVLQNRPRLKPANDEDRSSLRKLLGIGDEKPIVLYQGGIQTGRGLFRILDCASQIDNAHFVFIGGGALSGELRAKAGELGVETHVHFVDTVPHDELYQLTRGADIGVQALENTCANHVTTDSNKLFEYMHAGLAIVASDFPEIRKVVEDVEFGLLVPDSDTEALCSAIRKLVDDENLRVSFSTNAAAGAKKYSWEAQEDVLRGIYDKF